MRLMVNKTDTNTTGYHESLYQYHLPGNNLSC